MIKFIILFFFIPLFAYSQNIITFVNISKANEYNAYLETIDYDIYTLSIDPGYKDHYYKFFLYQVDSSGGQTILSEPKINVDLIIHRTDYKRPDGKVMWDYKTEVKSNDTLTNDYFEIHSCSYKEHLTCLVKVKSNEKYLLKIYYSSEHFYEFLIENGEAKVK